MLQPELVGTTPRMVEIRRMIEKIADSTTAVLISGPSGSGKEVVARKLHCLSRRAEKPFVALNCAAIAEGLAESELFGHVRGAFTDAVADKPGAFEQAQGGTLFLDEIVEMPLGQQAKFLRALEGKKIRRVGGKEEIEVDVRIIAATNQELPHALAAHSFRTDLYYRLAVVTIELPPLKDRRPDIILLVLHILKILQKTHQLDYLPVLDDEGMAKLAVHDWPGNVRELQNVLERTIMLNPGKEKLGAEDFSFAHGAAESAGASIMEGPIVPIREMERQLVLRAMRFCRNDKRKAAALLGISLKTLYNKLAKYNDGARGGREETVCV